MSEPKVLPSKLSLYLRAAVYWAVLGPFTVLMGSLMVLTIVLPLKWRYKIVNVWPSFAIWWLKVCCQLDYVIEGKENLPDHPSIIFAKHQSTWETFAIEALFSTAFVAKKELLYVPFFGWSMWTLQFVTIDRSKGKKSVEQMSSQARDRLAKGLWISIFPEGTRKAVDAPADYKIGGAVMATHAKATVVPVALNAGEYWPRHSFIKYPGTIRLCILPPIEAGGKRPKQLLSEVETAIETKMAEITTPSGQRPADFYLSASQ